MRRISSPGSKNSVSTCTHVLFSIRNWVFVVSIQWLLFLLLLLFFNVICKVLEWDPERHLDLENKPTGNSKAILHSQCRYTWMLHLAAFENSSKIFLRCIFITLDLLLLTTFINKTLDYQFDYILSQELEKKFWSEVPLKLRKDNKKKTLWHSHFRRLFYGHSTNHWKG